MPILKARFKADLDEKNLTQVLRTHLASNLDTAKQALTKIFTIDALKTFDKTARLSSEHKYTNFTSYANSFPNTIASFSKSHDVDDLCYHFLDILFMPFGIRRIDQNHSNYMKSRAESIRKHENHDKKLFKGTNSRRYVHGFSNHAYTFGFYLSLNRDHLTSIELRCVIEIFYYGYLKKNYHSFCEVDAAFLRAAENYNFPELTMETPKAIANEQHKLEKQQLKLKKAEDQHHSQKTENQHQQQAEHAKMLAKQTFDRQIRLLDKKIEHLKTRKDEAEVIDYNKELDDAYNAANTLKSDLTHAFQSFFANPTDVQSKEFRKSCDEHFKTAHKQLDRHRGWSQFLINLAIGIATAGIGLLIKGIFNIANNQSFFFAHKTESCKVLDQVEVGLYQIGTLHR